MALALEARQATGGRCRERRRFEVADRLSELDFEHPVIALHGVQPGTGGVREHGEDRAPHASLPHPRQVEVRPFAAHGQRLVALLGQRVVVSVENRKHSAENLPSFCAR